jgi:uncharacterized membrane protein (Fun14 family)
MKRVAQRAKRYRLKHGTADMQIGIGLITGFMFGFEFAEDDEGPIFVIDIGIVRIVVLY